VKKLVFTLLFVVLSLFFLWQLSKSRSTQLFGDIISRVETTEKVVALTFDDGPMPGRTQTILSILKENETKATFFLVGEAVSAHPQEAALIIKAGHEVGNHSYTHQRMVFKSTSFISDELKRTDDALREAGAVDPIHFRPPYGKKLVVLPYYLWRNDILSIGWDVEPESYGQAVNNIADISQHVINNVKPGSIILLHVMFKSREPTMNAVPQIIEGLKAKGYRFLTISELLETREN